MRIVMPNYSWFALILGASDHGSARSPSDVIVLKADNNKSKAVDGYTTYNGEAYDDDQQDIGYVFTVVRSEVIFTITRKLDTGDRTQDFLI